TASPHVTSRQRSPDSPWRAKDGRLTSHPRRGVTLMNRFSTLLSSPFRCARSRSRSPASRRPSRRIGLSAEQLDDRCLPSGSPLSLASNHNLMYGSGIVLSNVEQYLWSSPKNMGFALQQGGILDSFTGSSPSRAHATIGTTVESIALAADGTLYDLVA